jgi:hypothetical protein
MCHGNVVRSVGNPTVCGVRVSETVVPGGTNSLPNRRSANVILTGRSSARSTATWPGRTRSSYGATLVVARRITQFPLVLLPPTSRSTELGYRQLHHSLGSKDLLVEKRQAVEVGCENGDVIDA